jgi:hypothetical protein
VRKATLQPHAERELRQFQGHAAVVAEVIAEPQRAMELALACKLHGGSSAEILAIFD